MGYHGGQQTCAGTSQDYQATTELLQEPPPEACSKGFCSEINEYPESFLQTAQAEDFKDLTERLKKKDRFVRLTPPNDPLLKTKKQVDVALHREKSNRRNRMLEKARK
ncbi:MAG: hypothetical protein M1830_002124 [Pleopsidium flavum]|nr:MAG: hypothetical protein M1830_002124 [Pleopsidium flavum]